MAARELVSLVVVVLTSLIMLKEMPIHVSAAAVVDTEYSDTPPEDYNDIDNMGDNLPGILRLLGVLLESRYENKDTGTLRDQRQLHTIPYDKKELTLLLDKLSSSLNQEEQHAKSWPQRRYQENLPVLASKRAREELYGAMPPLNELCRMMKVKCY